MNEELNTNAVENQEENKVEETAPKKTYSEEEYNKLKLSFDKTSADLAKLKKEQRQSLSEDEQKNIALKEANERVQMLERQVKEGNVKTKLAQNGIASKEADELTRAFLDGDIDTFSDTITKLLSAKDEKAKADALHSMELPKGSMASTGITKDQFKKMTIDERVALKSSNPTLYEQLKGE